MAFLARSYNVSLGTMDLEHLRYMRPHSPGVLCPLNPAPTHQHSKGHTNFSFALVKLGNT